MASKKQQKAGFPLPNPITGYPLLDVCLKIPNAPEYRRAFLGHLNRLGLWAVWEKSYLPGDTRAKEAAELWREVLSKYLEMDCDMGCCPEPNRTRFNADGTYEISYDGGVTWEPGTDSDPRFTSPSFPPIAGESVDNLKCKAANNALQAMKDAQSQFASQLGTISGVTQLALALAGVVALVFITAGTAAFLVPLLLELAAGIINLSTGAYNALFTTDAWDFVFCKLYCNVGDDGQFTQAQFNTISADLDSHFTGNLALTFSSILQGWQLPGLNNAARTPSTANLDCSACDCPGDCASEWDIFGDDPTHFHGTIDSRGDGYIIASSGAGGYLLIRTPSADQCCLVTSIETLAGTSSYTVSWTDCGVTPVEGAPQHTGLFDFDSYCVNYFQLQAFGTFTVKLTFADCP